jgi:hypothetical protein
MGTAYALVRILGFVVRRIAAIFCGGSYIVFTEPEISSVNKAGGFN